MIVRIYELTDAISFDGKITTNKKEHHVSNLKFHIDISDLLNKTTTRFIIYSGTQFYLFHEYLQLGKFNSLLIIHGKNS